jgi:hypothetical protein
MVLSGQIETAERRLKQQAALSKRWGPISIVFLILSLFLAGYVIVFVVVVLQHTEVPKLDTLGHAVDAAGGLVELPLPTNGDPVNHRSSVSTVPEANVTQKSGLEDPTEATHIKIPSPVVPLCLYLLCFLSFSSCPLSTKPLVYSSSPCQTASPDSACAPVTVTSYA